MLIHPWDAATGDEEWQAWLSRHEVGTLIAPGRGRDVPIVVPTHFVYVGGSVVLLHLARPNPVWPALQEQPRVLLSVTDDWAYVPAAWKAVGDEDPALGIPTSYYAAVVMDCTVEVLGGDELLDLLRTQLAHFEPGSAVADPSAHERRLPGIRGLRLTITSTAAKFKFGGNVDEAHRAEVASRLATRGGPADLAARDQLLRRTPPAARDGRLGP